MTDANLGFIKDYREKVSHILSLVQQVLQQVVVAVEGEVVSLFPAEDEEQQNEHTFCSITLLDDLYCKWTVSKGKV